MSETLQPKAADFLMSFSVAIRDEKQPKSRFRSDVLATDKVKIGSKIGSGISFC